LRFAGTTLLHPRWKSSPLLGVVRVVTNQSAQKTDIRDYLRPVLKRWWLILAVVPIVTIGTYLYYESKPDRYAASTELFVESSALDQVLLGDSGGSATETTVENLALLIQTRAVANVAAEKLADEGESTTGTSIAVQPVEKSNFLIISATAASPKRAANVANAFAGAFIDIQERQLRGEASRTLRLAQKQLDALVVSPENISKRQSLEEKIQTLELVGAQASRSTGIKVVERAFPVSSPIDNDPLSHALFALVLSLVLSVGAAYALEYLTRTITSVEDVEEIYELPVLTEIPGVETPAPFLTDGIGMEKQLHEPFRRLQMNIDMLSHERPLRTILIASAAPGEGKSIVTRNLALGFREAGRNTAVFDADFRKATLGRLMHAHEGPGLTDILAGRASFGQAVQSVMVPPAQNGNGAGGAPVSAQGAPMATTKSDHGDLAMVPAGAHYGNLAASLASGSMRQTLDAAADVYDRVLIDSSPILAAADVLPLLSQVDGVLLVTRLGVTTRDSAARMMRELRRMPDVNVIGVVVNGIPSRIYRTRAYGYYYG
jgi:Mrp family chromosome partitioning ATPase/capsular polysaccharide biosynthesis protein